MTEPGDLRARRSDRPDHARRRQGQRLLDRDAARGPRRARPGAGRLRARRSSPDARAASRPASTSAVFQSGDGGAVLEMLELGARLCERLLAFPRPVVVACPGHAMAAGRVRPARRRRAGRCRRPVQDRPQRDADRAHRAVVRARAGPLPPVPHAPGPSGRPGDDLRARGRRRRRASWTASSRPPISRPRRATPPRPSPA